MGLHQDMRLEPVERLPLREAVMVSADETVEQAVARIRNKQLGCVIVVDGDRRPLGVFTESVLVKLLVRCPEALSDPVGKHMDSKWACVKEKDPIVRVLAAMNNQDIRFVVVTNEDGKVVALSGQKGLMEYIADYFPQDVLVQQVGQEPFIRHREGA